MPGAFNYRPRFVDIRVRPPAAGSAKARVEPQERICDHAGCRAPAVTRAPKSRDRPSDHYWFCLPHAAEYNRSWNFFDGLTEPEIARRIAEEQATGGRPTWSFKAGARNREAAGTRGEFHDPFGMFSEPPPGARPPPAEHRGLGKLERGALEDLDLEAGAEPQVIRARYLELVKRCHPDANGGDRSSESRLQAVIRAYKTLQKARLV